jgi:hypothetical protein
MPSEQSASSPEPTAGESKLALHRRTFLKAAALGTAAAAIVGKGTSIGPLGALADDLSTFQCTAGDVEILGAGQIVNEPCSCSGTFNATVQFTVRNNAASARGCITLHLVPNAVYPGGDILLQGTIDGKTTQTMTGTIQNYPCGVGLQCFGSASGNGRSRCAAGECSTISWTVPGQDACPPARQISSKCRHQQICVQGRGNTTVDCDLSSTGGQTSCQVPCGGNATVRVCTTNPSSFGPFTFTLNGQSFGPSSDRCHDFTVSGITSNTTLTATVTDSSGCAKSTPVTLSSQLLSTPVLGASEPDCDGNVTYTIQDCNATLTYTYYEVDCASGDVIGSALGTGCSLTRQWPLGSTHCVRATVSNGTAACNSDSNTVTSEIPAAVTVTLGAPQAGCSGVVTLTASAEGGVGPYTFRWSVGGNQQSESGDALTLQPQLDGTCRTVRVRAIDSRDCESASTDVRSFSQCVVTTTCSS